MKNNYEEILKKVNISLYVIIALLAVSLIINIINTSNIGSILNNGTTKEEETNNEYDVSSFTAVDYTGLTEAIKSKDYTILYIARSTCGYCIKFLPVMKQAQSDYGFTTTYFDITQLINFDTGAIVDQTTYNKFIALNDFFANEPSATPKVAIFKDGKFINGTSGYQDYKTYTAFLEANGIVKK
jgi:predicted bacteriocin transport accessory protein